MGPRPRSRRRRSAAGRPASVHWPDGTRSPPRRSRPAAMSGYMNPAEFANIARSEREFWWYRGMRAILYRLLDPYLAGRSISRALEAGCGTGYFSHLLQSERRLPLVPMDISADGLKYARGMGLKDP